MSIPLPRIAASLLAVTVGLCAAGAASATHADDACPKMTTAGCEWSTPGTYTWKVPQGVTQVHIKMAGAQGANNAVPTLKTKKEGGGGGYADAYLNVTPGETLQLNVGGHGRLGDGNLSGGFNGGGEAADYWNWMSGGGGGGASDIRTADKSTNNYPLGNRVIVVGGGGGATAYPGGSGGGANQNGNNGMGDSSKVNNPNARVAGGGTLTAGGVGAVGNTPRSCSALQGELGRGAEARSCNGAGGGGGGGNYGGGGGTTDGSGGGGSGYASPDVTIITAESGTWKDADSAESKDGQIIISW